MFTNWNFSPQTMTQKMKILVVMGQNKTIVARRLVARRLGSYPFKLKKGKTRSQILVSFHCRFCVKNLEVTILVLDALIIAYMTAYILSFQKMYTCHGVGETWYLKKRVEVEKMTQNDPKWAIFSGKCVFWPKFDEKSWKTVLL